MGYFFVVQGAGGLLVEGSELVGDVLDAFVLEPAGYAVAGFLPGQMVKVEVAAGGHDDLTCKG